MLRNPLQVQQTGSLGQTQEATPSTDFLGAAVNRLGPAGASQPGESQDGLAPGMRQAQELAGLNQALGALLGQFSQNFTDQKIASQSRDVLAIKEGAGNSEQLNGKVESLTRDYDQARQSKVQLKPETEELAQRALGRENNQGQGAGDAGASGGAAPANSGAGDAGGGASAAGAGGSSSGAAGSSSASSAGSSSGASGSSASSAPSAPGAVSGSFDSGSLDRALAGNAEGWDHMFSQFGQGSEGNCASIATIKGAMDTYGNHVFDDVQRQEDGGYRIRMQDGFTTTVSAAELQEASRSESFLGPDSDAKSYATLCYAAMARRAQSEHNDGAQTYQEALASLSNGENPHDAARYLGLQNQVRDVDPSSIEGRSGVVAWNSHHAVYADSVNGRSSIDYYGEQRAFNGTDGRSRELTSAFVFAPRSGQPAGSSQGGRPSAEQPSAPRSGGATSSAPTRTTHRVQPTRSSTSSSRTHVHSTHKTKHS